MLSYLIVGGTGSLGKKLINRLITHNKVAVYSRDESKHWTIRNEIQGDSVNSHYASNLSFHVGDIRDKARLASVIRQVLPNRIIIAAALKHVDTCEYSPTESIATNVIGTQNVLDVINDEARYINNVNGVLFVSTDKSCAPVNTYGMCKAISERLVASQALITPTYNRRYNIVRYGNVLESRGSIIPLFKYQAENNDFLTVTDPNMTRFIMTLDDSVNLIMKTFENGNSGDTWIPIIPAMRIGDLAEIFSELSNKKIKIIGLRPGEKMHEDLINESEAFRTTETVIEGKCYKIIKPSWHTNLSTNQSTYSSSDSVLTKFELKDLLTKLNVINTPLNDFKGTSIEDIVTNRVNNSL